MRNILFVGKDVGFIRYIGIFTRRFGPEYGFNSEIVTNWDEAKVKTQPRGPWSNTVDMALVDCRLDDAAEILNSLKSNEVPAMAIGFSAGGDEQLLTVRDNQLASLRESGYQTAIFEGPEPDSFLKALCGAGMAKELL